MTDQDKGKPPGGPGGGAETGAAGNLVCSQPHDTTDAAQCQPPLDDVEALFAEAADLGPAPDLPQGRTWRTLKDAYQERPPREYLVDPLFVVPSLNCLFGPPGDLKTMLLLDLACSVLAGHGWLAPLEGTSGVDPFDCQQAGVIWLDVDNGWDEIEDRFKALGLAHNVPEDAPLYYLSFPDPPFLANNESCINWLIGSIKATGARLVVIDNLANISGGADENSVEMVPVMASLRRIVVETRCVLIVIHHAGKGDRTRPGDRLRGHGSIEGSFDRALLVERQEGDDAVTVHSTKTRQQQVDPFCALFTFDADEGRMLRGRFYGLGVPESNEKTAAAQKAREALLEHMKDGSTQTEAVKVVKMFANVGRTATLTALGRLQREGLFRAESGRQHATLYFRTGRVV